MTVLTEIKYVYFAFSASRPASNVVTFNQLTRMLMNT